MRNNTILRIPSVGWASLALVILLSACTRMSDQDYVDSAKGYLKSQELRAAMIELKNALQSNPRNAQARFLLGRIYLDLGDAPSAEKELRRAGEAGMASAAVQVALAKALLLEGEYGKLLEQVEVRDDYPADARADLMAIRARALLGQQRIEAARNLLKRGEGLDPRSREVYLGRIHLALTEGDQKAVARVVEQALKAHPGDPRLLVWKGQLAMVQGNVDEAARVFHEVMDKTPTNPIDRAGWDARIGLVRIQLDQKAYDQAEATLAPLLKQAPEHPDPNYLGGLIAFQRGQYELAEQRLLKVLKVSDHRPSMLVLGAVDFAQHNYEQAAYYLAKYLASAPGNLPARKLLGRTYLALGQIDEAGSVLRPALASAGNDAELLAMVGVSDIQGGDVSGGIEALRKAAAAEPESTAYKTELAKAYISSGQTGQAIQELESVVAQGGDRDKANVLLVLAYLRDGKTDKAISAAQDLLSGRPDDPEVLTLVGGVYVAAGDPGEGRHYFERALKVHPGFLPATLNLGRLDEQAGKLDAAQARYEAAVHADPKAAGAMLALARLAAQRGDSAEAFNWLEKAHQAAPDDLRSGVMLGEAYLNRRQLHEAELFADALSKAHPHNPAVSALRAKVLMAGGHNEQARPVLDALVAAAPKAVVAYALQGENYARLGDLDEARKSLEHALALQPKQLQVLAMLAQVELAAGNAGRALELARQMQKDFPDSAAGAEMEGNVLMVRDKYKDAVTAYERAMSTSPGPGLVVKLYSAKKKAGDPKAAVATLTNWLAEHPKDQLVNAALGVFYLEAKQYDKAREQYERLLSINPRHVAALNNLAWLYRESNPQRALNLAERAYEVNPKDPSVKDTYGWLLVQAGRVERGLAILELAARELADNPEVRYHLAVAQYKAGQPGKARGELTRLLNSGAQFAGRAEAQRLLDRL